MARLASKGYGQMTAAMKMQTLGGVENVNPKYYSETTIVDGCIVKLHIILEEDLGNLRGSGIVRESASSCHKLTSCRLLV